jgi:hypothetical protein
LPSILVRYRVHMIKNFSIRRRPVLCHRSFAILPSQTQPNLFIPLGKCAALCPIYFNCSSCK